MKTTTALLLLLGLALGAAQVQADDNSKTAKTDIAKALKSDGFTLALDIFDLANVTAPASVTRARYTLLLPTDAAIQAFLKDMGLTLDDLKSRPLLAKQLVGQHMLLGANVREQEIFSQGETRKTGTLASMTGKNNDVEFKRTAPGKFTATDAQGNVATVGKPIFLDSNKTALPLDKVLFGDHYYTSFEAACKARDATISNFCEALRATGLDGAVKPSLDATVFVPNNAGFATATAAGKPSKEDLTKILKYHVVPGAREVPKQWKDGASFPTLLEGKSLKVEYSRLPSNNTKLELIEVKVEGVPVLKANVHVGKAVVHGIGAVLTPDATPAAAPAGITTEKGAKPSGRKLFAFWWA